MSALAAAAVLMATGSTLGYGDKRLTLRDILDALR